MKTTSLIIALAISLLLATLWEFHWCAEEYIPYVDDNKDLWASWRRKVPELKPNQVLIVGSSRAHFDLDIYEWEKQTGSRPMMLARVGTSPGPIIKDLAENTDFNGILLVGVAPDLFFEPPNKGGWRRLDERIDYFYKQTYAQRLNQFVFQKIDPNFSYINDHLQLKGLMEWLPLPQRDSVKPYLFWPDMSVNDANRNLSMRPSMETDTAMQNAYKFIWGSWGWPKLDTSKVDTVLNLYAGWVKTIEDRGGRIIFIRAPSSGKYLEVETEAYPREIYWDELLRRTNCTGIHFTDYTQLSGYDCPEWSHLLAKDAQTYTRDLCKILMDNDLIEPVD